MENRKLDEVGMPQELRIADRLRVMLQVKGWDAQHFQREMKDRLQGGKSGTAYNTILAYLNGQSEPSLEFLRQAADLLGVEATWLVFGEEPAVRTKEETLERQAALRQDVTRAVRQALGPLSPVLVEGIDRTLLDVIPLVARMIARRSSAAADEATRYVDAAALLGEAIAAPVRVLGLDAARWPDTVEGHMLRADYLLHVVSALTVAVQVSEWSERMTPQEEGEEGGDDAADR